jgi:NADH:ubiquinone oxidoreductase subunit D
MSRLYEIGFIERDFCFYFGLSGLLSRSAKILIDGRFLLYECYQCWDISLFFGSNSDCLDRYLLRFNEIIESCRIIYGIIFLFGYEGCFFSYYSVSSFSLMEWLIYTFLISFPFILSLHQSLKLSIESSKGIYSIFLNSFPYWTTYIICNDFLTLNNNAAMNIVNSLTTDCPSITFFFLFGNVFS